MFLFPLVEFHANSGTGNLRQYVLRSILLFCLIDGLCLRRLRRLTTFGKLVLGALFPGKLRLQELQVYSVPPPPPVNIFVKKDQSGSARPAKHPPPISSNKLVQELLLARLQAHIGLGNYMRNSDSKETTFLLSQGGRVPFVVA